MLTRCWVVPKNSAIQFYNTSRAGVDSIELVIEIHELSPINGISFKNCDNISVRNIAVSIISGGSKITIGRLCPYEQY